MSDSTGRGRRPDASPASSAAASPTVASGGADAAAPAVARRRPKQDKARKPAAEAPVAAQTNATAVSSSNSGQTSAAPNAGSSTTAPARVPASTAPEATTVPARATTAAPARVPASVAPEATVKQKPAHAAAAEVIPAIALAAHDAVVAAPGSHSHATAEHCLVCAEAVSVRCLAPCGHNTVCVTCAARIRVLAKDTRCLLCKSASEYLVATRDPAPDASYESFGIYGDQAGPELTLDAPSGIFFHKSADAARRAIIELRQFRCGLGGAPVASKDGKGGATPSSCASSFSSLSELNQHLMTGHAMYICDLCAKNRAMFVMELPRMNAQRLASHCTGGDPASGFFGHPLCKFCDVRHYGDNELFSHLEKDHFSCHFCARTAQPGHREYFNAYTHLGRHFRKTHFACTVPSCVAKRYVVFGGLLELRAHEAAEHGGSGAGGVDLTPHLGFRYRSARTAGGGTLRVAGAHAGDDRGNDDSDGESSDSGEGEDGSTRRRGGRRGKGGGASSAPTHIMLTPAQFPSLRVAGATGTGGNDGDGGDEAEYVGPGALTLHDARAVAGAGDDRAFSISSGGAGGVTLYGSSNGAGSGVISSAALRDENKFPTLNNGAASTSSSGFSAGGAAAAATGGRTGSGFARAAASSGAGAVRAMMQGGQNASSSSAVAAREVAFPSLGGGPSGSGGGGGAGSSTSGSLSRGGGAASSSSAVPQFRAAALAGARAPIPTNSGSSGGGPRWNAYTSLNALLEMSGQQQRRVVGDVPLVTGKTSFAGKTSTPAAAAAVSSLPGVPPPPSPHQQLQRAADAFPSLPPPPPPVFKPVKKGARSAPSIAASSSSSSSSAAAAAKTAAAAAVAAAAVAVDDDPLRFGGRKLSVLELPSFMESISTSVETLQARARVAKLLAATDARTSAALARVQAAAVRATDGTILAAPREEEEGDRGSRNTAREPFPALSSSSSSSSSASGASSSSSTADAGTSSSGSSSGSGDAKSSGSGGSGTGSASFVAQAQTALACVPDGFSRFREISAKYRRNQLTADAYHTAVVGLFDEAETATTAAEAAATAAATAAKEAAADAATAAAAAEKKKGKGVSITSSSGGAPPPTEAAASSSSETAAAAAAPVPPTERPLSVFRRVFPKLVGLLPDVLQRAALSAFHERWERSTQRLEKARAAEEAAIKEREDAAAAAAIALAAAAEAAAALRGGDIALRTSGRVAAAAAAARGEVGPPRSFLSSATSRPVSAAQYGIEEYPTLAQAAREPRGRSRSRSAVLRSLSRSAVRPSARKQQQHGEGEGDESDDDAVRFTRAELAGRNTSALTGLGAEAEEHPAPAFGVSVARGLARALDIAMSTGRAMPAGGVRKQRGRSASAAGRGQQQHFAPLALDGTVLAPAAATATASTDIDDEGSGSDDDEEREPTKEEELAQWRREARGRSRSAVRRLSPPPSLRRSLSRGATPAAAAHLKTHNALLGAFPQLGSGSSSSSVSGARSSGGGRAAPAATGGSAAAAASSAAGGSSSSSSSHVDANMRSRLKMASAKGKITRTSEDLDRLINLGEGGHSWGSGAARAYDSQSASYFPATEKTRTVKTVMKSNENDDLAALLSGIKLKVGKK